MELRNGFTFHGGCLTCTVEYLDVCVGCQYMEGNWSLPSMNPRDIEREKVKSEMVNKAKGTPKRFLNRDNVIVLENKKGVYE